MSRLRKIPGLNAPSDLPAMQEPVDESQLARTALEFMRHFDPKYNPDGSGQQDKVEETGDLAPKGEALTTGEFKLPEAGAKTSHSPGSSPRKSPATTPTGALPQMIRTKTPAGTNIATLPPQDSGKPANGVHKTPVAAGLPQGTPTSATPPGTSAVAAGKSPTKPSAGKRILAGGKIARPIVAPPTTGMSETVAKPSTKTWADTPVTPPEASVAEPKAPPTPAGPSPFKPLTPSLAENSAAQPDTARAAKNVVEVLARSTETSLPSPAQQATQTPTPPTASAVVGGEIGAQQGTHQSRTWVDWIRQRSSRQDYSTPLHRAKQRPRAQQQRPQASTAARPQATSTWISQLPTLNAPHIRTRTTAPAPTPASAPPAATVPADTAPIQPTTSPSPTPVTPVQARPAPPVDGMPTIPPPGPGAAPNTPLVSSLASPTSPTASPEGQPTPPGIVHEAPPSAGTRESSPLRIRIPMSNGETVRGQLVVNSRSNRVRLVLAAQDETTARSMSTAHEMLRHCLAREGFELNSFVVRYEGQEMIRMDTPDDDAEAATSQGHGADEQDKDTRTAFGGQTSGEPNHAGPMDLDDQEDPMASGWFL